MNNSIIADIGIVGAAAAGAGGTEAVTLLPAAVPKRPAFDKLPHDAIAVLAVTKMQAVAHLVHDGAPQNLIPLRSFTAR